MTFTVSKTTAFLSISQARDINQDVMLGQKKNMIVYFYNLQYYKEPETYRMYLDRFNEVFTFLFTLEAILKLYVFRLVKFILLLIQFPNCSNTLVFTSATTDLVSRRICRGSRYFSH